MESVEIYIGNQKVDLNSDVNIKETKQINSLFDIKERRTSYTNKFNLPFTTTNKKIFSFLGVVGNQSTMPYTLQNVNVIRNGVPTISGGIGIIMSFDSKRGYSISIKDGNVNLFDAIGSKKLSDLDFSSINHNLSSSEYKASLTHGPNDGFIYPLIDSGRWSSSTNIFYEYQAPCLFIAWIWDQIITQAGFSYSGTIFSTTDFENKVITVNTPPPTNDTPSYVSRLDVNSTGTYVDSSPSDMVYTGSDPNGILYDSDKKFKVQSDSVYKIVVDGSVTVTTGEDLMILEVLVNGVQKSFIPVEGVSMSVNHEFILNLSDDDEVQINLSEVVFNTDPVDISYNLDCELFRDDSVLNVVFADLFQDGISQKDFIKSIIQYYGLVFRFDGTGYEFKAINDLLTERSASQDWTSKFISNNKEVFKVGSYGQSNKCSYSYEDNSPESGDGHLIILDQQLDAEKSLFTPVFKAASLSERAALSTPVYETPHWESKDSDFIGKKASNYIFDILKVNGTMNFKRVTDLNDQSFTGDFPIADFTGMYWPLFLTTYYDNFRKTLNKAKTISVDLKFTWLDMYELDLIKLVFISQLGAYFYINKITKAKDKTTAELVEIPDLS